MKETLFKNLTFSLIITNIWTICAFFIYFFESPGWFHGFGVFGFYLNSCWVSGAIGVILILLRFFYFKNDKKNKLSLSFLYCFFGIFNLLLFALFLILALFEITHGGFLDLFLFANPITAVFILFDIYKTVKLSDPTN
ncbi:hypothetical protein AB674_17450 [Flavobacterium sp. ABG]|nr:hypothetical protein AB674_17450 [Flavobacterium sp. ABG]